jgi:hypothetical protein
MSLILEALAQCILVIDELRKPLPQLAIVLPSRSMLTLP